MYTVASFFSGCSGSDLGFKDYFKIVFAVDLDYDTCVTYRANIGPIFNFPISSVEPPPADIFIGGPPCQSFTNARTCEGYRSGTGMIHIENYIRKIAKHRPKLAILENSPTLCQKSLSWALGRILDMLDSAGYTAKPYLLNAEDYGVPQSRIRTFILCSRKDTGIIFLPPKEDHWRNHYLGWADYLELPNKGILLSRANKVKGRDCLQAAYTVIGAELMAIRYENVKDSGFIFSNERDGINQRYLTIQEIAKLQGFPTDYKFYKDARKQIGNSWSVHVSKALAKEAKGILDEYYRKRKFS